MLDNLLLWQYQKYVTRQGDRINYGDAKGGLAFVWYDLIALRAVSPDPRFITFRAILAKNDEYYMPVEVQPVTLEKISRAEHSEFFAEGNFLEYMESLSADGLTDVLTIKDPHNYTLVDELDNIETSRYLSLFVQKCDNLTSSVPCAYFGESNEYLRAYLNRFTFGIISLVNQVDYESEIEPFKGPVAQISTWIADLKLELLDGD